MDSNSSWDLEGWERGIAPSVSKDRWIAHARTKLSRGYALIVNETRRNANFFKVGRGYEACRFTVAVALIRSGAVVAAGRHALGTLYLLSPDAAVLPVPAPKPVADPDDDEPMLASDDALLALAGTDLEALTDPAFADTDLTDADLAGADLVDTDRTEEGDDDPLDRFDDPDAPMIDPLDALFDGASFGPGTVDPDADTPSQLPRPRS